MEKPVFYSVGKVFPTISGHDLDKNEVFLPKTAHGHVALIVLVSNRNAQPMVDSWISHFERELCECEGYMYYEVPMISGAWGRFFSGVIDGGMRAGIPAEKHHNVMTYYGDYKDIYEKLGIKDMSLAYPFLIDKNGIIRWNASGFSTQESVETMIRIARQLHDM